MDYPVSGMLASTSQPQSASPAELQTLAHPANGSSAVAASLASNGFPSAPASAVPSHMDYSYASDSPASSVASPATEINSAAEHGDDADGRLTSGDDDQDGVYDTDEQVRDSESPPVVRMGASASTSKPHANKRRTTKLGLPEDFDADLYGLRRSVSSYAVASRSASLTRRCRAVPLPKSRRPR